MAARTRVRPRLSYAPQWEGPIQRWTAKFARNNIWRCQGLAEELLHDADDFEQDCYLKFIDIKDRYPRVSNPRHFMSLYMRAVQNMMHDRARLLVKRREVICNRIVEHALADYSHRIGEVTNQGYLNALLAEAPEELRLALNLFDNDPNSLISKKRPENLNMKLRRILGIGRGDEPFDFHGVLLGILKGA